MTEDQPAHDPPVTLIKPGSARDVTYVGPDGPIRFVEGRAEGVPLSVARKLAGQPGWWIEQPRKKSEAANERI
jgi:hypothetical protein